jgi:hypothetical protein
MYVCMYVWMLDAVLVENSERFTHTQT